MLQPKKASGSKVAKAVAQKALAGGPRVAAAAGGNHPFAEFVRTVGRGQHLSRSLTEAEAERAMAMVLEGEVEPAQLGAFLLVLRYRGETPAELAGFVRAARRFMEVPGGSSAALDWPSYADRHRQLPYFILAALLLAEAGVRVAMHGLAGIGAVTTPKVLQALGIAPAGSVTEAERALEQEAFAYLPVEALCRPLAELFELRPVLGVRSAVNTFARELNPLGATCQLQGVFHPTYLPVHQETALLLGQPRAAIFKGGGGEVQRNPEKACRSSLVLDRSLGEEVWQALTPGERHGWREEPLDPAGVVSLWRGERSAPGPEAAIIGTAAIAFKLLGRAEDQREATALAMELWRQRPKAKYGR